MVRTVRCHLSLGIVLGLLTCGKLAAQPTADAEAAADSRALHNELRQVEAETRRIEARIAALTPHLERRAMRLQQREAALDHLPETRAALPLMEQALLADLRAWVARDLPFLPQARQARIESLATTLADPDISAAQRLERLLAGWRRELDYGREMDAWRGLLEHGDRRREVDFLRLGRVGLYYLTPDGREGGVWRADAQRWSALDDADLRTLRDGLRIAREQRAPEVLVLPLSQPLERTAGEEGAS